MAVNGNTKALITPPPRWVSAPEVNVLVSTREWSRWYGQNLCRTLLSSQKLFIYLHYLRSTIFPLPGNNEPYRLMYHTHICTHQDMYGIFATRYRTYGWVYIRERGSVLYLGMATEILNLPYFCITQIMAKEATDPKPSMQREWYCLAVHKYTRERTFEYAGAEKQTAEKVGFRHLLLLSSSSSFSYKTLD